MAIDTTTNVTDTRATLNGRVNAQGEATNYAFQYGTTTDYGQQTRLVALPADAGERAVTTELDGLVPGTDYNVRVIASNASGTEVSANATFRTTGTAPAPTPRPSVTTGSAVASLSTATLTGTVNPQGRETVYYFEFGETANYGQQTAPQNAGSGATNVSVQAALSGLRTDATYNYRLVAVGPNGSIATGENRTFTTGGSASTMLSFFGHTSFTDQNGVGGVFLGCFGAVQCRGGMTLERSGKLLGERKAYTIRANNGGIVHITLNDLGKRLLRQRGAMNVRTTVLNENGQRVTGTTKLIRYSTNGLKG
ncbi:fibronectin type III domain-containing protein [Conexibacter arvalis]|uniref:Phosphodiesterase/alkaline phosphatase D-like protein n=1 Tax=Conexibacter arvalis TaxID=912552 RepID=A0A840ILF7_9ACTN|nr:fibronectin type III domain-containing protein [Conexibacter arvalis]MBB4665175.1 phosphodiesterase/alkaline phosphatase D-like protein [Conexibacter arvalis]